MLPRRTHVLVILLVTLVVTGIPLSARAGENAPSHEPKFVPFDGSYFFNYDGSANIKRKQRDWPISLIFWDNASIDKVKVQLAESYVNRGSKEWEPYQLQANKTRLDADKGKKTECYNVGQDTHFRIYAPSGSGVPRQDRFFGTQWGYFAVASTHFDFGDGCPGDRYFGYTERAAEKVAHTSSLVGMPATEDYVQLYNREPIHRSKTHSNHIWQNDGKATVIRVP